MSSRTERVRNQQSEGRHAGKGLTAEGTALEGRGKPCTGAEAPSGSAAVGLTEITSMGNI